MKILQMLFTSFFLLFANFTYTNAEHQSEDSSQEKLNIADNLTIAISNLPPIVFTYDVDGKATGFKVKNPDGIGVFHFGDTCLLSNGSPIKFLAPAIPKDVSVLDTKIYVEYMGGISIEPRFLRIKTAFCPEHAVVAMSLNDYLAFERITTQTIEEKKYLRTLLRSIKSNCDSNKQ